MSICIKKYLSEINIWPGIQKYVLKHSKKYILTKKTQEITDSKEKALAILKELSKQNLSPSKERENFRKAITSLYTGEIATLKSENIYRLLFTLGFPDDTSANDFLTTVLNRNELSARNMDEFIIICALRLKLSWEDTFNIRNKYNSRDLVYAVSSNCLVEGQTLDFYQNVINAKIHDISDLEKALEDKNNFSFWAKTRNKHYFALFYDIDFDAFNTINLNNEPLTADTHIKLYEMTYSNAILSDETPVVSMQNFYNMIFNVHSSDDPENLAPESFLTSEESTALASIYPDAFLTYDTFCKLVQRTRKVDISQGVFLLRILEEINPYYESEKSTDSSNECEFDSGIGDPINFADKKEFLLACNNYLLGGGFPELRPNNIFSKLVLDIYDETKKEFPELSSLEFKRKFFEKFRYYLKEIAALKK